jgi:CRISPR-associated protein Csb1
VTISYAEQMTVISLPALRRLQFPLDGKLSSEANNAARTVLAALGLCGAVLAAERGLDLRSRCLLWPTDTLKWDLLDRPGKKIDPFELDANAAIKLLVGAVKNATKQGLPWLTEPLKLKPAKKLVELVRKSQELAIVSGDGGEGGGK